MDNQIRKVFAQSFFLSLAIELFIQCISLVLPLLLIIKAISSLNLVFFLFSVLIALYLYPFNLLIFSALFIRLIPLPEIGKISDKKNIFRYALLISLENFVGRTPARHFRGLFPFPGRLYYAIVGSKLGKNVMISPNVSIWNPYFLSIGDNSVVGEGVCILGHYENNSNEEVIGTVDIGENCVIGQGSLVFPDVIMGDNVLIASKSVVKPGTNIPDYEMWGGIPAKKIKKLK